MKRIAVIDFETLPIEKRPDYPPKPVGVAIIEPNKKPYYMAWAHPSENNCTKAEAKRKIKELFSKYELIFHNGKFDLEVSEKFFGTPLVPKHGWHDSMLLAFLHNPREPNLKLKPLADKWLDMKPVEQDKLHEWILENIKGAKQAKTKWGRYIYLAPAKLVGRYAKGDVIRTKKLYEKFYKYVKQKGMAEQYDIEKRVVIKALDMEREGITLDTKALEPALIKAKKMHKRAENAVFKTLGDINLNSGPQKVEAFERLGLVEQWEYTDKGNPKTGIESLMNVCTDKKLVQNLEVFSKLSKIIGTYMQPWLNSARENNGKFYPWFNTLKGENDRGTYTGRLSSNFQQVPREPMEKKYPHLRNFVIADKKSHTLFNRDFCAQEIRILAHFEDGALLLAFIEDPHLDPHNHVRDLMTLRTGRTYDRKLHVKPCNFLVVYGGGIPALSKTIKCSYNEAKSIMKAHGEALSGVGELKDELKLMNRRGELFKTAGGRWYDFEEGREFVALNTLIQGSAADHSKRALLNIDDMLKAKNYDARLTLTVHDEYNISGSKRQKVKLMKDFKEAMELDKLFDLPMLTDGKIGERWGTMEKVK